MDRKKVACGSPETSYSRLDGESSGGFDEGIRAASRLADVDRGLLHPERLGGRYLDADLAAPGLNVLGVLLVAHTLTYSAYLIHDCVHHAVFRTTAANDRMGC